MPGSADEMPARAAGVCRPQADTFTHRAHPMPDGGDEMPDGMRTAAVHAGADCPHAMPEGADAMPSALRPDQGGGGERTDPMPDSADEMPARATGVRRVADTFTPRADPMPRNGDEMPAGAAGVYRPQADAGTGRADPMSQSKYKLPAAEHAVPCAEDKVPELPRAPDPGSRRAHQMSRDQDKVSAMRPAAEEARPRSVSSRVTHSGRGQRDTAAKHPYPSAGHRALRRAADEFVPTVAEVAKTFGWLPKLLASFATVNLLSPLA
jgi:hypothetical protein